MKFAIGFILGVAAVILAGYLFIIEGGMPVATKGPPLPFERKIAHMALRAAMKDADTVPPIEANEINMAAGAKIYTKHCAVCHGVPSGQKSAIAKGLFPQPPELFYPDEEVTDDPPGKIYWKVKNGIRLTGMPGFGDALIDQEIWQVSLLLKNADKISDSVKKILTNSRAQ